MFTKLPIKNVSPEKFIKEPVSVLCVLKCIREAVWPSG